MLTPFGKALRKLRIDRGMLLKDMADGIGIASSFLSGMETGRKSIPEGTVEKIGSWAKLDKIGIKQLTLAAEMSKQEFKITANSSFTDNDREAAMLLARFGELPRSQRDKIHAIFKKELP
jgi:transcriptional regulator with XRE-family HTH domain